MQKTPLMTLRYRFENDKLLEFSDDALSTFNEHRQVEAQNESGGILVGRIFPDSRIRIEIATSASGCDDASRFGFKSSRVASQAVVDALWEASNATMHYLGEWHTHPKFAPTPSSRDRRMIRNMF